MPSQRPQQPQRPQRPAAPPSSLARSQRPPQPPKSNRPTPLHPAHRPLSTPNALHPFPPRPTRPRAPPVRDTRSRSEVKKGLPVRRPSHLSAVMKKTFNIRFEDEPFEVKVEFDTPDPWIKATTRELGGKCGSCEEVALDEGPKSKEEGKGGFCGCGERHQLAPNEVFSVDDDEDDDGSRLNGDEDDGDCPFDLPSWVDDPSYLFSELAPWSAEMYDSAYLAGGELAWTALLDLPTSVEDAMDSFFEDISWVLEDEEEDDEDGVKEVAQEGVQEGVVVAAITGKKRKFEVLEDVDEWVLC